MIQMDDVTRAREVASKVNFGSILRNLEGKSKFNEGDVVTIKPQFPSAQAFEVDGNITHYAAFECDVTDKNGNTRKEYISLTSLTNRLFRADENPIVQGTHKIDDKEMKLVAFTNLKPRYNCNPNILVEDYEGTRIPVLKSEVKFTVKRGKVLTSVYVDAKHPNCPNYKEIKALVCEEKDITFC